MPRPERAVDPAAGPLQRFAHDLRMLRRQAGEPGYRELAAATGFSTSTLAAAARGERLPSLRVTLAYAVACGGDEEEWRGRWRGIQAELATPEAEPAGDPPYLGLAPYETADAGRFFGRDALAEEIAARARRDGFVAVFGPSGSGKSSLLRAGVVPALDGGADSGSAQNGGAGADFARGGVGSGSARGGAGSGSAQDGGAGAGSARGGASGGGVTIITPAAHPGEALRGDVLIVDQFEDVFTRHPDEADRREVFDALLRRPGPVIIAVRADFYGRLAEHPGLTAALRDASILVGAMRGEELREAIVKPAAARGLMVEPALVARVIQDAGTEPGALPLVSHALQETWRRRRGKVLTLAGYEAAGGVHGAIADTAEGIYGDLSEPERKAVRRLLLRLVTLTRPETPETRRPARRRDLTGEFDGALVERLTAARLLTASGDEVEIAHEALIRTWPRFRDWLAQDQEGLRRHRRLGSAAAEWDLIGRDEGSLYQGARLALAADWAAAHPDELSGLERDFLDASIAAERAGKAAAERRTRTLKALVTALSVLLVVALVAGVLAVTGRAEAEEERRLARSRQLAAEAMAGLPTDVRGAAGRAVRAYRTAPTVDARSAVLSIAGRRTYEARLAGHAGMAKTVAFRPDGGELATGGQDGVVIFWGTGRYERRTGSGRYERRAEIRTGGGAVRALAYSPDGALLATASLDGRVALWRTADRSPARRMTVKGKLEGLAFSPDGRLVAASGEARRTVVWDAVTGRKVDELAGHGGLRTELAFAPDGRTLAIADEDGRVVLWEPARDERLRRPRLGEAALHAVAFAPDGRTLAAAGADGEVHLWDLRKGELLDPPGGLLHGDAIRAVAFADGGRTLVSAGHDGVVKLWDVRARAALVTLTGHTSAVYDVAVSPDGNLIASAGADQTSLVWDRRRMPYVGHTGWVNDVSLGPDGRSLVSAGQEGSLMWWNAGAVRPVAEQAAHRRGIAALATAPPAASRAAPSAAPPAAPPAAPGAAPSAAPPPASRAGPDGRLVASGGGDGLIKLWRDRRLVATLRGHADALSALRFAPDGRTLAAADLSGAVVLWDAATGRRIADLKRGRPLAGDIAFSPDGRLLATGGADRAVTLWDVAARRPVATLPGHPGDVEKIAFSPDGRTLAAGGGGGPVLLWDVRARRRIGELAGHRAEVRAIAFSPSGDRLATAGLDRSIIVWDPRRRTRWATLTGHTDLVLDLDFDATGDTLVSGGADRAITTWPLAPPHALHTLRTLAR